MENENKCAPASASQGNSRKHNNRRRPHKPKGYFLTPADTQTEKNEKNDRNEKAEATPSVNNVKIQNRQKANAQNEARNQRDAKHTENLPNNEQGKQKPDSNGNNRNRKKHKKNRDRHNEQHKDITAPIVDPSVERQSAPVQAPTVFTSASKSDRLEKPAPKKLDRFSSSPEYEKYSDYEEFTFAELYGEEADNGFPSTKDSVADNADCQATENSEPMVEVVGIKFKESGKTYYFTPEGIRLRVGSHAIVKTARGLEYGDVAIGNTMVKESETVPPLRPVVRIATDADIKHHEENKEKEDSAFRICNEKIIAHELDMKLIDAQYTFDNSKLLFYFTSSGRVDFRDLVKDLAAVFKTRIELRQVGIRDEAKMVGGFGPCGRALCCSLFLTDFGQVSIKMAKEQNLSLNSSKISGICGRLMCCLRYEYENYEYEIKRTPPVDTLVRTVDGVGTVTEISPLAGTIKVRLDASPEVPPKSYKREAVTILKKKQ